MWTEGTVSLRQFVRGPLGTPKFLRVGEDYPTVFSHEETFVFQLLHQAAEMLRREGKQLSHFPILQYHLNFYRPILVASVLGLGQFPKELLQALSPGETGLLADAERAGSQPSAQHRQYPSGESCICIHHF